MRVHCYLGTVGKAASVELWLADAGVKKKKGLSGQDTRRAQQIVAGNRDFLISEWQRIKPLPCKGQRP